MQKALSALVFLSVAMTAGTALADVAPPAGLKRIGFSFTLRGLTAAPEQVVFAYPCSTSSGAPVAQHRLIEEAKAVPVGTRGGACTLYTMPKATYDEWLKTYTPTDKYEDKALDALAAGAKKCTGAPSPAYTVKSSDPRTSIDEVLDVTKLSATECTVVSTKVYTDATTEPGSADDAISAPPGSNAPAAPGATGSDGGGGCSMSSAAGTGGPWLLALAVPAFIFLGSRRRKKQA